MMTTTMMSQYKVRRSIYHVMFFCLQLFRHHKGRDNTVIGPTYVVTEFSKLSMPCHNQRQISVKKWIIHCYGFILGFLSVTKILDIKKILCMSLYLESY